MSLLPMFLNDIVDGVANMTSTALRELANYLNGSQATIEEQKKITEVWAEIEILYNKKLWHQLTLKILDFVKYPHVQEGDTLIKLYNNFITKFEMKINPMSLIEVAEEIIKQYKEPEVALEFLKSMEQKVKSNERAQLYCKVIQGRVLLNDLDNLIETKQVIGELNEFIENSNEVSIIHQYYYLLASQYYERDGNYDAYYRNVLRYLACFDNIKNHFTILEQQQYAYRLCISAILSEEVYNFGELLLHPILASLENTTYAWTVDLVKVFNSGNLILLEKMRKKWSALPEIKRNETKIFQKIRLLGVMEIAFIQGSHGERYVSFDEIAKQTQLPKDEVEFVVMKAFAKGLIRGSIDQINETVHVSWVQPRVLETSQINRMIHRIDEWCQDVKTCEIMIENKASEILTN